MLERVFIKSRSDSPYVLLDANEGYGEITGKSYPPDVALFYEPIVAWFEEFKKIEKKEFELIFKLDYINTASYKMLMDLMFMLEELVQGGKQIIIKWFYPEDDSEMYETGAEFESMLSIKFQYIGYDKKF